MTSPIRAVLAPLAPPGDENIVLAWGKRLGDMFGATVDAAYVRDDWKRATNFVGGDFGFYMTDTVLDQLEEAAREAETRARDAFEDAAEHAAAGRFGRFIRIIERFESGLARAARCFDLAACALPGDSEGSPTSPARCDVIETVMIGGGAPVFAAPAGLPADAPIDRVLIAWNGSHEAARALRASVPFLKRAGVVHVARFGADGADDNEVADAVAYLAAHEVEADASQLGQAGGGVADAILSHAKSIGANLIVMGGYGRARWIEETVGGVTKRVLRNAKTPVLLAH